MSETTQAQPVAVREAQVSDLDLLAEFNAAMALETEDKALDREKLARGVAAVLRDSTRGRYLVAERGGLPVGALMLTLEWSDWRDGWFWWIQSVYVAQQARRTGVYRALYEAVLDRARAAGDVIGVRLYVEDRNAGAQRTYEALGMSPAGYRMYQTTSL